MSLEFKDILEQLDHWDKDPISDPWNYVEQYHWCAAKLREIIEREAPWLAYMDALYGRIARMEQNILEAMNTADASSRSDM